MSDFATIATYSHPADAHLLRSFLESEGIAAFVLGEHTAGMHFGAHMGGVGGMVRVQVDAEDEEAALELLAEYEGGEIVESGDGEDGPGLRISDGFVAEAQAGSPEDPQQGTDLCPKCGSDLVYGESLPSWLMLLSILLLFIPLLLRKKRLQCHSCGHIW